MLYAERKKIEYQYERRRNKYSKSDTFELSIAHYKLILKR